MAHIFILAGQSNMVGTCSSSRTVSNSIDGVEVYWDGKKKGFCELPFAGPEYEFASHIRKRVKEPVKILKCAANGTSLLAWAPEWTEKRAAITQNVSDGPMYQKLVSEFGRIYRKGDGVRAIFWMQGERDCKYKPAAMTYLDNFRLLVSRLRKDISDVPLFLGRVNPPVGRFPFRPNVRDAQDKAASVLDRVICLNTDDIPLKDDALHHTFQGMGMLGRRFAEAYIKTLS